VPNIFQIFLQTILGVSDIVCSLSAGVAQYLSPNPNGL
jgi:hypothetical protein